MRTPISKRICRDFRSNFIRYAAIFTIIFCGIALGSGFFVVQKSVLQVYEASLLDGNAEDGQISVAFPLNEQGLNALRHRTKEAEKIFSKEIAYTQEKTVRAFVNRKTINTAAYYEGRPPDSASEVSIDRLFAEANNWRVGDHVAFGGKSYVIVGVMALPDYSTMLKQRGDIMADDTHFGSALFSQEGFDALGEDALTYTYSFRWTLPLSDKESLEELTRLTESLIREGHTVTDAVIRPLNTNISYFRDDMGGDVPMILTLLVMIFLLMAFLFTVIIKSTIEEEAPVIGTLLSLGYRRGELIRYYMSLPLLITLAAALFGNVFGYTVMKDIFLDLYYSHYSLFPFRLTLDAGAFILTSSLPLVLIAAVNFLALRQKLRFSPLRFLRRDLKKRGVRKAFRLPVLPFLSRFRLRVLLQNKVLFLVMFVGLLLANLLLLYGVSAAPIIDRYTAQLGESMPARYEYHLRGPIGSSFGGEFTVYSVQSEKNYGGRRLMITLYGYENEMPYLREYPVTPGAPEAYASRGIMEKMKLRVGDTIDLYDKYQGRPIRLKLIGQTDDANLNLHMSREALNQLMQRDSGYYNGIFSDEKLDIDERMIVRVLDSDKMEEAGRSLTLFVRKIIPPVLVVSVAIFLVVVLVLSHVIVQRSAHSICCLRVFGYTRQEIGKIYLGVTDLALIVFELVSIPAGAYLLKVSMTFAMSKFNAYIHPVAPWPYYFIPAAVGILLYQLGKALQMRRLERADLSEALKENFG